MAKPDGVDLSRNTAQQGQPTDRLMTLRTDDTCVLPFQEFLALNISKAKNSTCRMREYRVRTATMFIS